MAQARLPSEAFAPLTAEGVMRALDHYGIQVHGLHAVILGRSHLVGQPLALLLGARGATVTLLHSQSQDHKSLCEKADLLVSAVGKARFVQSDWIKPGAVVVNVGTTFTGESIVPDIPPISELGHAFLVVRTLGPTSVALCLRNVAQAAASRPALPGATASTPLLSNDATMEQLTSVPGWSLAFQEGRPFLTKDFWFPAYSVACQAVQEVCQKAELMNHHPNLKLSHHCTHGVVLTAEISTYVSGGITDFDFALAKAMDQISPSEAQDVQKHVPEVHMKDFEYELPEELIARSPAEGRRSRLLLIEGGKEQGTYDLQDRQFLDLPSLLPSRAHLVFNESKVISARMFAHLDASGPPVEVMFLAPHSPAERLPTNAAEALHRACHGQLWNAMIRMPLREADAIFKVPSKSSTSLSSVEVVQLSSKWVEEGESEGVEAIVRLRCSDRSLLASEAFGQFGHIPLPPYMRRDAEAKDLQDYQTVYAKEDACGSVAAPTAGLHFTDELLGNLEAKGIRRSPVTLHVGAGTFRPVTAKQVSEHAMHTESFSMEVPALEEVAKSLKEKRPVVAVGTTTVRTLESLYWLASNPQRSLAQGLHLGQWEAYSMKEEGAGGLPAAEALQRLCDEAKKVGLTQVAGSTSLCIVPGYEFKVVQDLVTNFHQPDSTLLLLVAAFTSRATLLNAYAHAVANKYRFLSYGDACLFLSEETAAAAKTERSASNSQDPRAVRQPKPGEKVLLHSCCAPCSGAMIEEMHTKGLDVTIFFYNPNIHPRKEYEIRKNENVRYAEALGIPFVDCDYDVEEWYARAKGMEYCLERGPRCSMCFDMRLERTALHAHEHGFQWITTTNATSRWKDAKQVNASGVKAAFNYPGVTYWVYDWQTETMTDRKYEVNAKHQFYKQEYCGCSYSLRDNNYFRAKEGLPPIKIGGGDVYSDPAADAAEESEAVVSGFFAEAKRMEEIHGIYGERRRGPAGKGNENW